MVLSATAIVGIGLALAGRDATGSVDDPSVGVAYPFRLYTHCGILSARFGGRLWRAQPPLTDGSGNPPKGWDNPQQAGTMRLLSRDEAEFEAASGQRARFVPLTPGARDPAAGCS